MCQSAKADRPEDIGCSTVENSSPPSSGNLSSLDVPGSQIHREPMPSPQVEELSSKKPSEDPPSEKSFAESESESSTRSFDSNESLCPDEEARPLREPIPQADPNGTKLLDPKVSSKMHQSHRWLRLRNFFAERRSFLRAKKDRKGDHEEDFEVRESAGREISFPQVSFQERATLSFRATSFRQMILREALAVSQYRTRSQYLRAALTGRDRRASIVGKAGVVFYWVLCHLGEPVGSEAWSQLGGLIKPFLSAELATSSSGVGKALRFVRRHLLARQLASEIESESGPDPGEVLPPAPEQAQKARRTAGPGKIVFRDRSTGEVYPEENLPKKTSRGELSSEEFSPEKRPSREVSFGKGFHVTISFRLRKEQKRLIEDNARYSDYADKSKFLRSMSLGWDRSSRVLAQCAEIISWAEGHLGESIGQSPIGGGAWAELDKKMARRFGSFLFGGGGEKDVDRVLQDGARHLLGVPLKTIAEETGIQPKNISFREIVP